MIAVRQLERPYTYEDLAEMPDDGRRYEVIGGELVVSPSPSSKHQLYSSRLLRVIGNYLQAGLTGEVFSAPYDVVLGVHDILEPDLVVILNENGDKCADSGVIGAPDLIVEIISPSSRTSDRIRKSATYAQHTVPEYWIIDPERETIEAMTLKNGQFQPISSDDGLVHSVRIAGLVVDPGEIFAAPSWKIDRTS